MADEQSHPEEQDPLENGADPLANDPDQASTNRPADNARVAEPSEIEGFGWIPSDEATDFLGLNDSAEEPASGDAFGGVNAYAMPGEGSNQDTSRTTWLLNEAAQPNPAQPDQGQVIPPQPQPIQPEYQTAEPGTPADGPSWLMDGQEPAPQPAPPRADLPLPQSIQSAASTASAQAPPAGPTDPNWLLSLDEQKANQGGDAPVVDGSQEFPTDGVQAPLDASFVDPEPTRSAVSRVVMRSLIAVGVVAGGAVLWQVLSHHGELDQPIDTPLEMERTAQKPAPVLDQPIDSVPGGGVEIDPRRGTASAERTAIRPEQTPERPDVGRRWFSNLAPRAGEPGHGSPSEPSELDGDSYPWAGPTEQEASEARSVLLAFEILMGEGPLADAGTDAPVEFDSLGVVLPDALPEVAGDPVSVGPPPLDSTGVDSQSSAGPGWLALGQRLLSADRSVLDQYNAWRLNEDGTAAPGLAYVPRAGVSTSIEPTLETPWLAATIGAGGALNLDSGPMPASDFEPVEQVPGSQVDPADDLVAVELPLDTLTAVEPIEEPVDLDPRRIEQDPLFTLKARVPGIRDGHKVLDNHWAGTNIPMHALDYPERILTPRVGAVRIFHANGEGFEGHLFAMGMGSVWLDTGIGRMAMRGDRVHRIEKLDEQRLAALEANGTPTAGLPEIRVTTAGGVFVGFELEREGDRVTMVTDKGYKITLNSDEVVPATTKRATIGIRRRGR